MFNPARYDITIHQGATFELLMRYKDASGVPVNMSGYTVTAQLWDKYGVTKLADFSTPWKVQASGLFAIRLESTTTSGITQQGQYDVMVTAPNNDKYYLLQGTSFIDLGLTGR